MNGWRIALIPLLTACWLAASPQALAKPTKPAKAATAKAAGPAKAAKGASKPNPRSTSKGSAKSSRSGSPRSSQRSAPAAAPAKSKRVRALVGADDFFLVVGTSAFSGYCQDTQRTPACIATHAPACQQTLAKALTECHLRLRPYMPGRLITRPEVDDWRGKLGSCMQTAWPNAVQQVVADHGDCADEQANRQRERLERVPAAPLPDRPEPSPEPDPFANPGI